MNEPTFNDSLKTRNIKSGMVSLKLARAFTAFDAQDFRVVIDTAKDIIRSDSKCAQAHYLIGRVAVQTGQLDISLKAFEAAVNADPNLADYWAFLALVYSQSNQSSKAANALTKASNLGCNNAYACYTMAHVYSTAGQFSEASNLLIKATELSPKNSIYFRALGVNYLETGHISVGEEMLEQAVSLNGYDAESWWTLSSLSKATNNERAEKILTIMQETKKHPREHAYLAYAAGKWFEDTQSWDNAFAAFEQGSEAKRKIVDYDNSLAKRTFAALKELCNAQWLNATGTNSDDCAPIFVVGQPRTGTTLIERIISSHSKVHSAGEPVQLAMALRAITGVRTREFISAELVSKAISIPGAEVATAYLSGLGALRGNTPFFVDKFPMNFMLIGFIAKAFPNAKIIHVTRSPADTCFAVYKQLFEDVYPHSYKQSEMAEHFLMYRDLMAHWHTIMPGRIYDVAYEDVVADNTLQAQKLIAYCGLEWEEACSHFEKNKSAVATASSVQVREPVHSRSIGRWKMYEKQLAPTIAILEAAGVSP
jgi:tetratricopeptide (TPR) repeat protein